MLKPGARFWVYLAVAVTCSVGSRLLDASQKLPTGLVRTVYEGRVDGGVELERAVSSRIDLAFVDQDPGLPRRFFAVKWEGVLVRTADEWVDLYAGGDDEIVVAIDGEVVIDRNPPLSRGKGMARLFLPAGIHPFEVRYRQEGGGYGLYVLLARAGRVASPIDPESLFPRPPPARRLRTNARLLLLRRVALGTWVLPPIVALLVVGWRAARRPSVDAWQAWRARTRLNLARATGSAVHGCVTPAAAGTEGARPRVRRGVAVLYVGAVALFLASIGQFHEPRYGFTRFIRFGANIEAQLLPAVAAVPHPTVGSAGYDGQFYAQLAIDPTLRDRTLRTAVDSVVYRGRRILLSWTAFVLGLGRPAWILQAYALQNVLFWIALAIVLLRWLPPVSVRHWLAWCACLFGSGAIASVLAALTDLPGVCLAAIGLAAVERGRPWLGAPMIGLSGLARESSLVAAAGFDWLRIRRPRAAASALLQGVLLVAPLVLWTAYMATLFGPRVWSAGGDTLVAPFSGVAQYLSWIADDIGWGGWHAGSKPGVVALVSIVVQAMYLAWRADWHQPWWRYGIGCALLLPLLDYPVWEGSPGAFVRVALPLTIAFNIALPASRWFWPLFVLGNMTMALSLGDLRLVPWL